MTKPLDEISTKQLQEIEQLTNKLLMEIKKTSLRHDSVYKELTQLAEELSNLRRARFDLANPPFGY